MKRLLIYSQDGMGLGHLRRTASIAHEILLREPGCSVLVLADSPATPPFDPIPGIDYLKLPTIVKTGDTTWRTGSLPMTVIDTVALRARLIAEAAASFEPDTILVDHMPVGALGELKPMLDTLPNGKRAPRLFLSLRDILDDPAVIRPVWAELGAYDYLARYEAVLVFGCREMYDADAAYSLGEFARRVEFCNYALRRLPPPASSELDGDPLLLVMGGGGGDAYALQETFLRAAPALPEGLAERTVILTGPNMPRELRHAIVAQAAPHRIRVEAGLQDATEWIMRTSAVLMMAGYNSLCEAIGAGKRALVVPRKGPSAEQRTRTRLFAARNLIATLDPDELTPSRLAQALTSLLADDSVPDLLQAPPMDGASRAAELMLSLAGQSANGRGRNGHEKEAGRAAVRQMLRLRRRRQAA